MNSFNQINEREIIRSNRDRYRIASGRFPGGAGSSPATFKKFYTFSK